MDRMNKNKNKEPKQRSDRYLRYSLGRMLPQVAIYGGYLFILVGLISLFVSNPFLGIGIILLGMLVSFTFRGVIIDVERREITTYTSIFWLKRDKTVKNLTDYEVITVNRSSMSYRSYSWMNKSAIFTSHYYTLFLSREPGKRGIPVATFKNRNIAMEEARRLEKLFNLRFQATRM